MGTMASSPIKPPAITGATPKNIMMKGSHCVALVWPNLKNTGMDTDAITNPMALQNARANTPA